MQLDSAAKLMYFITLYSSQSDLWQGAGKNLSDMSMY